MRGKTDAYVVQVNKSNMIRSNVRQVILILSFLVVLAVFWGLKLTGITMAGEAFCGKKEHVHDVACLECPYEEHIHDATCYSDFDADIETEDDWEMSLAGLTRSFSTAENVVSVAMSQLGYEESTRNFEVDANGIRRGITRYGQWYGNPYGDWSAMFAAFCLHYAGVEDVPFNAGAEAMRREWKEAGMYAGISEFSPRVGNLLFLHREYEEEIFELPEHTEIPVATPSDAERIENVIPEKATPSDAEKIENAILEKASPSDAKKIENMVAEKATPSDAKTKRKTEIEPKTETVQPPAIVQESEPEPQTEISLEPSGLNAPPDSIVIMQVETDEQPVVNIIPTNVETEVSGPGNTVPSSIHADPETLVLTPAEMDAAETAASAPIVLEGPPIVISAVQEAAAAVDTPQTVETVSVAMEEPPEMTEAVAVSAESSEMTEAVVVSAEPPEMTEAVAVSTEPPEMTEAAAEPVEVTAAMPSAVASALQEIIRTEIQRDDEEESTIRANAVAIITGFEDNVITVIEGDLDGMVEETEYYIDDPALLGYGLVAEEPILMMLPAPQAGAIVLAKTTDYDQSLFNDTNCFVVYTISGDGCFAFDGGGNAIPIYIDEVGDIYTDIDNPDSLLWTFTSAGSNSYLIQNVESGRYMHAYPNNGTGVTTSGAYSSTLISSGVGVKIRSNSEYARLDVSNGAFVMTQNQSLAAEYQFGIVSRCTVWFDGTDGGLGHLTGSPNEGYTVKEGAIIELPSEWASPSKYSYKLRGWYDVTNDQYYLPGEEMEVTGNAVLYADWIASTYDIGVFNAYVADTVSTNSFITTHMFDYNYLINLHSVNVQSSVSSSSHSETWSMVTSGNVDHGNQETFDFIFIDNDSAGLLCMPNNRNAHNIYPGAGVVTPGIYTDELGEILFSTENCYNPASGAGILGKSYLGTGDYLFQIMDDPSDEHYGYYYYDSKRNAASYNQSNSRFYVYEYLEATSDAIGSTNSDFLPLNSPYANTNGKTVGSYNYNGVDGEYAGVPHFRYDSKYNSGNYNSVNNVQADYAYGMRTDIRFYLPNDPGSGGNKDLYGNDMQFQFSGDDDLWVLIDGQLVLDIGGIHGAEDGMIDFSTGQITVQGKQQTSLMELGITAGDHTLSVLYLERGSSLSNCSIYFNMAPRFGLQLQKEDVLTQELLDGTQFTVYEDFECTIPAELWENEEAYNQDFADGVLDQSQSTFTVTNGTAKLWGFGSGNTYYIKETGPPNAEEYGLAEGVIRLTIEKSGQATYHVDVIADAEGNEPSNGFTVHGVKIDEEKQIVYFVVTNAPETVTETTTVQVLKKWEDDTDHSGDYITAYLKVTDPDGTVRRIREITLSDENDWIYTWTNLPKYDYEALTEVQYGIEESYESGYYSTVRKITQIEIETTEWAEATSFINGESYILKNGSNYLSTTSTSDAKLKWVDEETAQSSSLALWTATVSGGKVKFMNGTGQILTFNYSSSTSNRYFYATTNSSSYQSFTPVDAGSGFRLYTTRSYRNYYIGGTLNSNGQFSATTSSSSGMILTPMEKITNTDVQQVQDWAYQITNTPLDTDNETSVAVNKIWEIPLNYDITLYQEDTVTVRLFANGIDTGRTVTLNLKNGWIGYFLGLPYADEDGNVIQYTVEENWNKEKWVTSYGEIIVTDGSPPSYTVEITNTYHPGGPMLPSTGTAARLLYILCGTGIILATLVCGIGLRRKRERRKE